MGAATETELEDRKLRIEDAKNATFAAVEEGIVPGGGAALLHLAELVPEFRNSLPDSEERLGADLVGKVRRIPKGLGHTPRVGLRQPACPTARSAWAPTWSARCA